MLVWEPLLLFAMMMVMVKILGDLLVARTSGFLNQMLAQEIDTVLAPEAFVCSLFDQRILTNIAIRLIFFYHDLNKMLVMLASIVLKQSDYQMAEKVLVPEGYWSGTPPNHLIA